MIDDFLVHHNHHTSGTSACPPYHLAIVIGGLSAEQTLKTVKMASTKYYDTLPTEGNAHGRAFRCLDTERRVLQLTQQMGIGAQFGNEGGRYGGWIKNSGADQVYAARRSVNVLCFSGLKNFNIHPLSISTLTHPHRG